MPSGTYNLDQWNNYQHTLTLKDLASSGDEYFTLIQWKVQAISPTEDSAPVSFSFGVTDVDNGVEGQVDMDWNMNMTQSAILQFACAFRVDENSTLTMNSYTANAQIYIEWHKQAAAP